MRHRESYHFRSHESAGTRNLALDHLRILRLVLPTSALIEAVQVKRLVSAPSSSSLDHFSLKFISGEQYPICVVLQRFCLKLGRMSAEAKVREQGEEEIDLQEQSVLPL